MNNIKKHNLTLVLPVCILMYIAGSGYSNTSRFDPPNPVLDSIFAAAENNDVKTVEAWIETGGDIEISDKFGRTMLFCAVSNLAFDVVELLIYKGSNVNHRDLRKITPLELAALKRNEVMIRKLVKNGAVIDFQDEMGNTPLNWAVQIESDSTCQVFLELGADPDISNLNGQTPIFTAVAYNDSSILDLFMSRPISQHFPDKLGHTILHHAAYYNNTYAIEKLLKTGMDVNTLDTNGMTPLGYALDSRGPLTKRNSIPVCGTCMRHERQGRIHEWKGMEAFKLLLDNSADPDFIDWSNPQPLIRITEYNDPELLHLAISGGADVNAFDTLKIWSPLHKAAAFNHPDIVDILINNGADLSVINCSGATPLTIAVAFDSPEALSVLIENGADLDITIPEPDTLSEYTEYLYPWISDRPLQLAIKKNNPVITRMLIDAGADINIRTDDEKNLLHLAAERNESEIAVLLIDAGLEVDELDVQSRTPLHLAIELDNGGIEAARTLLENGANPNLPFRDRSRPYYNYLETIEETMLHRTVRLADSGRTALLLEFGAKVNIQDDRGITPFQIACGIGNVELAQLLLSRGADPFISDKAGISALHRACANLRSDVIRFLLSLGFDANIQDRQSLTPLCWLIDPPQQAYIQRGMTDGALIAALLIDNGADWRISVKGKSLFEIVISKRLFKIADILLKEGADFHLPDENGNNLMMRLISKYLPSPEMVEWLLEVGEDPNAKNNSGETALLLLAMRVRSFNLSPRLFDALIRAGAEVNIADANGKTPLHYVISASRSDIAELLLIAGADPNIPDKNGILPILNPIRGRDAPITKLLLEYGANPNGPSYRSLGGSFLHYPAADCYFDIVELLLEHGADPNTTDDELNTPLHLAVSGTQFPYERGRVVKALLNYGADRKLKNKDGKTAVHLAGEFNVAEIIDLLDQ